jgi:hypothetical protein
MRNKDEGDESSVALFYIQEVQGLEWLRGRAYKLNLRTRIRTTAIKFGIC